MVIIGLTGSIGMGKTTVAGMFRAGGIPVHDADAAVHELYAGVAVPIIEAQFPGTTLGGIVNRAALAKIVLANKAALKKLEGIVHPLVEAHRDVFLAGCRRQSAKLVVLDVPLLFETGMDHSVDKILVVSAPAAVQRKRVLERPGMSVERFEKILVNQLPDFEKRQKADFVVSTDGSLQDTQNQVNQVIQACSAQL